MDIHLLLRNAGLLLSILLMVFTVQAQRIPFELDPDSNTTFTHQELTHYYTQLLEGRSDVRLFEYGPTDVGKPLHLIVVSKDGIFDPQEIKDSNKAVMLINNGIHPGEPEGIDASMMFLRDLLNEGTLPEDVVLCLIPVYNIAGMLNRGTSRVNQNGPVAYGFRGSRQNYDLNRDFIKGDSRNSRLFQHIFSTWDPDLFLDTHASNGADYQYIMTLIETQRDKLHPKLADYMASSFTAPLYQRMHDEGFPMIPYVYTKGETPESGLITFLEGPRYSSGYAALHHTIGYIPETHMWKPYSERVASTYALIKHLFELAESDAQELVSIRKQIKAEVQEQTEFPISWRLDTTRVDSIEFRGYHSDLKASAVSGEERRFYDRTKPFVKTIPHYSKYQADVVVEKPNAYVVPQAYDRVINLLQLNGVEMRPLERDTILDVEMYRIVSFATSSAPYEGRFPHHQVKVEAQQKQHPFYAGDWVITTDQAAVRYILETLEPEAIDSFFRWNFFDAILSQKEHFSPYIFEDKASRMLASDEKLRKRFQEAKDQDADLANNGRAQLDWIYKNSKYYEDSHLLYPVARKF